MKSTDHLLTLAVAQAQGRVSVQAHCSIAEALVLMRDRAKVERETLDDIARGVLERSIRFGSTDRG